MFYPCLTLLFQAAFAVRSGSLNARASLASVATTFIASLGISYLSIVEHRRTIRPSTVVIAFLLLTSLISVVWWTVPLPKQDDVLLRVLVSCQIFLNLLMLVNESYSKRKILTQFWHELSNEETSGLLERALFLWINPILAEGYRIVLLESSLPRIHSSLSSSRLRDAIWEKWNSRGKIHPSN